MLGPFVLPKASLRTREHVVVAAASHGDVASRSFGLLLS